MGKPPGAGGPLTISGPNSLTLLTGDLGVSGQYTANKTGINWSADVIDDGILNPGDYSVSISSTGLLTVTLSSGVVIPPSGATLTLTVNAIRGGGSGNGSSDSLNVSVVIEPSVVPCFVAGTAIETERGAVAVEKLCVGDLVMTGDGQFKPIVWIGSRKLSAEQLKIATHLCPIRIRQDAFGTGRPSKDLFVSPQHRIVIEGWGAEILFGTPKVLAHACHLIDDEKVTRFLPESEVCYVHFVLQDHDIVYSNGILTETMFLGEMALKAYDPSMVDELLELFPEFSDRSIKSSIKTVLPCLTYWEASALMSKCPAATCVSLPLGGVPSVPS
jgi:hypothetical protein